MRDAKQDIPLRVVSRDSPLSLLQVKEAFSFFPSLSYRLSACRSLGDKSRHISLMDAVPADFFTRELDELLIRREADVAVHSAKDLPYPLPAELELFALLEAFDKTDSLVSRGNRTLPQLPAGARVGTSSAARKAELLSRRPDVEVVSVRGAVGERLAQVDSGHIDALIVATCALKRLGMAERIAEVLPFRAHPLQGNLAIVGRKDQPEIKALFAAKDIRRRFGKVHLVGFGPGNPDCLTIGGDKILAAADAIFYDDLVEPAFLEKYRGEKICVGKRKGAHRFPQEEIGEKIYQAAIAGKRVARLKGGDPMIFAHGREELDFLQSRLVEVEVVPGISAGVALAACTHIPLTHRGLSSSVAFVAGHSAEAVQAPSADTLVYYMGGANIAAIAQALIASGRRESAPAALVYNVSLPNQTVWYSSLSELRHSLVKHPTPILMIVGEVVSLESRHAHRQQVLLTGTSPSGYPEAAAIRHTPLIRIDRIADGSRLPAAIARISAFDWIVFTSRHGVRCFFEAFDELKADVRALAGVRLASVGKTTTAELSRRMLYPDLEPPLESAEGLVQRFRACGVKGKRMLLPRSDKALRYLAEELEKLGNRVLDLPVYRNTAREAAEKVNLAQFQKIVFSSPSGVDAFMQLYGQMPSGVQLIAKGKTTETRLAAAINE
ncbi:MAG: uroporphyrinogen-III C-methyltransferase [Prevotellaceae bacterium]|nr:uroporphyrinogen-III C-methyltransferase [Prevotellaceae bacterium]